MFIDTLSDICKSRGITVNKLLLDIGLTSAAQTKWKKGSTPNGHTLQTIADYLGVTVDCLIDKKEAPTTANGADTYLSEDEATLVQSCRQLNADGMRRVLEYAEDLAASGRYAKKDDTVSGIA